VYGQYIHDLINDPEHKPVMSRANHPKGEPNTLAAALHVPVYEDGVFKGTLGGAIYFNKFQDAYLRNIKFGNNGFAVLMDDNGHILYHPDPKQNGENLLDPKIISLFEPQSVMRQLVRDVQAGKSGSFKYKVNGMSKVGLYKTFGVPDVKNRYWAVVVAIPVEDLQAAVNEAGINRTFIVLVLLFSFIIALLTFLSLHNSIKNFEVQRMKDDFISITSHQLRTPATIVKQNLGLIIEGYATSKKDVDKLIRVANESNDDQLSIIENILSVSRLEAGRLELQPQPIVLQDLLTTTVGKMVVGTKKHTIHYDLPKRPVKLRVDPTKLAMAVDNLVSNAIKYTQKRGTITISLRTNKESVMISVEDNGRGISKDELPQLFKRFNRLHSAVATQEPGTGLGLYLTKKIVELHGGTIAVRSKVDQGSTFTITLPKR